MINNFFDRIYYINLDERSDRRKYMKKLFNKEEIEATRFPAIIKRDERTPKFCAQKGCFLSHQFILKEAEKNNFENVFIFEDDIYFKKEFKLLIDKLRLIPEDWDFIYLGGRNSKEATSLRVLKNIFEVKGILNTHAYGISRRVFSKVLGLNFDRIPLDYHYLKLQQKIKCYAITIEEEKQIKLFGKHHWGIVFQDSRKWGSDIMK